MGQSTATSLQKSGSTYQEISSQFACDIAIRLGIEILCRPITITSTICDDGSGYPSFARITSCGSYVFCASSRSLLLPNHYNFTHRPINAKVTLCEAVQRLPPNADDERYGRYRLYVTNSDSPISLQVEHAVPAQGSSLYLNVSNTVASLRGTARTMVTLDRGFEGNFDIRATGTDATPVSVENEDATDDRGGIRYVSIERLENDRRSMSGKVFWDSPAPPLDQRGSDVYISTAGEGGTSLVFLGD
jgi:hypothetical protein